MIELRIKGNLLSVRSAPDFVLSALKKKATIVRRGHGNNFTSQQLYDYKEDINEFITLTGLYERVFTYLNGLNIPYKVISFEYPKLSSRVDLLSQKDRDNLRNRPDQVEVISKIVDSPLGFIVDCPTGWGKSFVIARVCQILPDHTIAVVCPSIEIMKTLYDRISECVSNVGMVGGARSTIKRITVCTKQSVKKLNKQQWDLLLYDEVHTAAAKNTSSELSEVFHMTKTIGFSATPLDRSDGSNILTEALFGPIGYSTTYKEAVADKSVVPIKVFMINNPYGPDLSVYGDNTAHKQKQGIVLNKKRNKMICEIINMVPKTLQLLIMTETAEHAITLYNMIEDTSDYHVVFSQVSSRSGLKLIRDVNKKLIPGLIEHTGTMDKDYRDKAKKDFETGVCKRAIATSVWSTGVDFKELKVVIRAEGIGSKIRSGQVAGRLSRLFPDKSHGILIDFNDTFDSSMRNRSSARVRMYKKNGYEIYNVSLNELGGVNFDPSR